MPASSNLAYQTATDTVAVTDNDVAGVTLTPLTGLTTTEAPGAGHTATFTVVLTSQPTGDVTISLSSNDTGEGTVSPATLTFTSGNWNETQLVTVTGVPDGLASADPPARVWVPNRQKIIGTENPVEVHGPGVIDDPGIEDEGPVEPGNGDGGGGDPGNGGGGGDDGGDTSASDMDSYTRANGNNGPAYDVMTYTWNVKSAATATSAGTLTVFPGGASVSWLAPGAGVYTFYCLAKDTLTPVAPDTGNRTDEPKLRTLTVRVVPAGTPTTPTTPLSDEKRKWFVGDPIEAVDSSRSNSVAPESTTTFSVDAGDSDEWNNGRHLRPRSGRTDVFVDIVFHPRRPFRRQHR